MELIVAHSRPLGKQAPVTDQEQPGPTCSPILATRAIWPGPTPTCTCLAWEAIIPTAQQLPHHCSAAPEPGQECGEWPPGAAPGPQVAGLVVLPREGQTGAKGARATSPPHLLHGGKLSPPAALHAPPLPDPRLSAFPMEGHLPQVSVGRTPVPSQPEAPVLGLRV